MSIDTNTMTDHLISLEQLSLPTYVTSEEVKRVCQALGFRDWTQLAGERVTVEEAQVLLPLVNITQMPIELEQFRAGLDVELEHGVRYPDANVTNNHPVLTAKIVLAHLKESLDYYLRLEVAELEADLLAAVKSSDKEKMAAIYTSLSEAKQLLVSSESDSLKK